MDASPSTTTQRGGARGRGRGASRGRGGRGGRGSAPARGRGGGGRGRGRGSGRGFPRGRGGPSEGAHRRHKPRAGSKRHREEADGGGAAPQAAMTDAEREKKRQAEAYFGVTSTETGEGESTEQPASKVPRKDSNGKTMSAFTTLRGLLSDAASLSEYVHEHRTKIKKGSFFNDTRATNMFLQAISGLPDSLYAEFIGTYKSEVVAILERMLSLYSVGKVPMTPPAHEFVIRCEQNGVRSADWAAGGIAPLEKGEEPSLLTPRELVKRLASLDPVSRLQRQIELSHDIEDVAKCVKKFAALQTTIDEASDAEHDPSAMKLDYATRCQVISKIVSKTRRLLTRETGEAKDPTASTGGPSEPNPDNTTTEAKDERAEKDTSPAEPVPNTDGRLVAPLDDAQKAIVRDDIAHTVLTMLLRVLDMRPPGSLSTPITKIVHFAEWALPHGLITSADHDAIVALKSRTDEDLEMQAAQLETVMKLKAVSRDDDEGLRAIADQLWTDGDETHLEPSSVDVLSALAVAASPDTISDDVKKIVFDRLVATQRHFLQQSTPIHMPRRTMRFLNEVRNKERDVAITKLQAKEEAENSSAKD